jgi:hypothetical protein
MTRDLYRKIEVIENKIRGFVWSYDIHMGMLPINYDWVHDATTKAQGFRDMDSRDLKSRVNAILHCKKGVLDNYKIYCDLTGTSFSIQVFRAVLYTWKKIK